MKRYSENLGMRFCSLPDHAQCLNVTDPSVRGPADSLSHDTAFFLMSSIAVSCDHSVYSTEFFDVH